MWELFVEFAKFLSHEIEIPLKRSAVVSYLLHGVFRTSVSKYYDG